MLNFPPQSLFYRAKLDKDRRLEERRKQTELGGSSFAVERRGDKMATTKKTRFACKLQRFATVPPLPEKVKNPLAGP